MHSEPFPLTVGTNISFLSTNKPGIVAINLTNNGEQVSVYGSVEELFTIFSYLTRTLLNVDPPAAQIN